MTGNSLPSCKFRNALPRPSSRTVIGAAVALSRLGTLLDATEFEGLGRPAFHKSANAITKTMSAASFQRRVANLEIQKLLGDGLGDDCFTVFNSRNRESERVTLLSKLTGTEKSKLL